MESFCSLIKTLVLGCRCCWCCAVVVVVVVVAVVVVLALVVDRGRYHLKVDAFVAVRAVLCVRLHRKTVID